MVSRRNEILWGICTNTDIDGGGNPCPNCAQKTPLAIRGSHKFECPECKAPLTKVPAPKTWWEKFKWLVIGSLAFFIVGGGIVTFLILRDNAAAMAEEPIDEIVSDVEITKNDNTVQQADVIDSLVQSEDTIEATVNTSESEEAVVNKSEQEVEDTPKKEQDPKPAKVEKKIKHSELSASTSHSSGSKNLGYATFKGTLKNGVPDDVNGRLVFSSSHVIDSKDPKGRVAEPGDYVICEFSEVHLVQGIWYGSDNVVKGSIIIGK